MNAHGLGTVPIGGRSVGPGWPVYIVAEAGSNHDGRLDQARRLIDVAATAGCDAVKFQMFRAASLYPPSAGRSEYLGDARSIYDVIRDLEMPPEWVPTLAGHARDRGLDFLCTPFDEASADLLDEYVPAFKIASYEMTHHPLIDHVARKGKAVIVSTGTADLEEVGEMVAVFRATGNPSLILMQCTAHYPARLSSLNLGVIARLRAEFGCPAGLSDHSREPLIAPLAAAALGASVIEKHFTLSNALPGPDHAYAVEPEELAEMVRGVRAVERALGDGVKRPHPDEMELRSFARRSIFATRDIAAGERLTDHNIAVLRCGTRGYGLHPSHYGALLSRCARRPIRADELLRADDVA